MEPRRAVLVPGQSHDSAFLSADAPALAAVVQQRLQDHTAMSKFFSRSMLAVHLWRCLAGAVYLTAALSAAFWLWRASALQLFTGGAQGWLAAATSTVGFVSVNAVVVFTRYHVLAVHREVYAPAIAAWWACVKPSSVLLHVVLVGGGLASAALLLDASSAAQRLTHGCHLVGYEPAAAGPEPGEDSLWFLPEVQVTANAPRLCLNGSAVLAVLAGAMTGLVSSFRCLLAEEALLRLPTLNVGRTSRLVHRLPAALAAAARVGAWGTAAVLPVVLVFGGPLFSAFDFVLTRMDGVDAHISYVASTTAPALAWLFVTTLPHMLRVATLVAFANQAVHHVLDVLLTECLPMATVAEGLPCVALPRSRRNIQTYSPTGVWRLNTHLLRQCGLELAPPSALGRFMASWHTHDRTPGAGGGGSSPSYTAPPESGVVTTLGRGALCFLVALGVTSLGLGVPWGTLVGVALSGSVLAAPPSQPPPRGVMAVRLAVGVAMAFSVASLVSTTWVTTAALCFLGPLVVVAVLDPSQAQRLLVGVAFGCLLGAALAVPLALMDTLHTGLQSGLGVGVVLGVVLVLPDGHLATTFLLSDALSTAPDAILVDAGKTQAPHRVAGSGRRSRSPPRRRRQAFADADDQDGNAFGDGYGYGHHPDKDMTAAVYHSRAPQAADIGSLLDRKPTRAEAHTLSLLAAAAKPSEVAACKDLFVKATAWDDTELLHKWRQRMRLAEVEAYAGRAPTFTTRVPLIDALCRSLTFASAATMARTSVEERLEVFEDASGRHWLDLMWMCTATLDTLSVALQVAAVAGVAPQAAHCKTPFARRGGHAVFGFALNEWQPYDPVVEQARCLAGGLRGARKSQPPLLDLIDANPTRPGHGNGFNPALDYTYPSQRSSAYAYRDTFKDDTAAEPWQNRLHPRGFTNRAASTPADTGIDEDGHYVGYRLRWRDSDDDASEYGLLRHVILRCRRSSAQKTQALFDDAHAVMCAAETVSFMCAASLEEDDHGVVQHTLSVVLASLLTCQASVEAYVKSPAYRGGAHLPSSLEMNGFHRRQPTAVATVLEQSVVRLVETFGHHLKHVALPPLLRDRLRLVIDSHPEYTTSRW